MDSSSLIIRSLLACLLAISLVIEIDSRYISNCNDTPNETQLAPCRWGRVYDECHRRVCGVGPGERCGRGEVYEWATCGTGLYCVGNKCHGCSAITMECYSADRGHYFAIIEPLYDVKRK